MDVEPGQLVKSLVGRDKGKHYLIIDVEDGRVVLANGRSRSMSRPKKKNPKHLQSYNCIVPGLKDKIRQKSLNDTEVRDILNTLMERNVDHWLHNFQNSSESGS